VKHYRLEAILAVGFRVRSHRGTQFRQWATERLREYLVKGFSMDDERLKNPSGPTDDRYFEELLARIRDIRSSERVFYRKVLDIYATSVDYDPSIEASQLFFKTVLEARGSRDPPSRGEDLTRTGGTQSTTGVRHISPAARCALRAR
jgi:hypothetical protein